MLNIILGVKDCDKFLEGHKFVDYNDGLFNDEYREEWFEDQFVREVLEQIDHIDLTKSNGVAFKNKIIGDIHSQRELSTGCKTLILMYKYPNVIFQARFGDNCTEFVERLAANQDLTIKSDYLHAFDFKYLYEINYINYGLVAKGIKDIIKLFPQFYEDNVDNFEDDYDEDLTEDEMWEKYPYFMADLEETLKEHEDGNN